MRLIRFGNHDKERFGVLVQSGGRRDLSRQLTNWNRDFFNNRGLQELQRVQSRGPLGAQSQVCVNA